MKRMLLMVLMIWCAETHQSDSKSPAVDALKKEVSYSAEKKSVQYVVIDLARLVGLGYNWNKSFAQTDPECRRWVFNSRIKNKSFDEAMTKILKPVGLRYEIEGSQVVLYRR